MPEWAIILIGVVGSLAPIVTGYLVARRYQRLGGDEAQIKLNVTLKDLNDAYEEKLQQRDDTIAEMRIEMATCKERLETMEERDEVWMREKIELKRELAEVYRRLGMTRREGDPQL